MVGPYGLETSSDLHTDVRTQWVEWKNIGLQAGAYEVRLDTSAGCHAVERIEVVGGAHW